MALIELPQESRHSLIRAALPYSTSANQSFQFIWGRKRPVDSQRVRALLEAIWRRIAQQEGVRAGTKDVAGTRVVGCAAGVSQVQGSDVSSGEEKNLSYETRQAP